MTEQKNAAPQALSDDELDAVTGGASGSNPLLHMTGDPYSPINSPITMTGTNPLYVPNEPVAPLAVPPATSVLSPTPEPTVVVLDSATLSPSGSLNIAAPTSGPVTIQGSISFSGPLNIEVPEQPGVTEMTFADQPYTTVTPTVRGVYEAAGNTIHGIDDAFIYGGGVQPKRPGS